MKYSRGGEAGDSYTLSFIAGIMQDYVAEQRAANNTWISEKESGLLDFLLELILATDQPNIEHNVRFVYPPDWGNDTQPINTNGDFPDE